MDSVTDTKTEQQVLDAVNARNTKRLRELSLKPGGFGEARKVAWPFLLQADPSSSRPDSTDELQEEGPVASSSTSGSGSFAPPPEIEPDCTDEPHKDESQIALDTARSFVLYPDLPDSKKEVLKSRLNTLITRTLRKRRKLAYVQGYHDVLSVLLLTLAPGPEVTESEERMLERCAERMSLYRFRDAMGHGLEPLLGLLRILRRLIRLADPEYVQIIEQTTPLPYYALSNLLTLFAHDVPTLPLIQHIWDYLLAREPVAVVYLTAALILERKDELLQRMREDGDEGALYVLLSGLPPLLDGPSHPSHSTPPSQAEPEPEDSTPPTPTSASSLPSYTPSSSPLTSPPPPVHLPSLLQRADDLMALFPPSHPDLKLSQTLGPASVHRSSWPPTISESPAEELVLDSSGLVTSLDLSDDEEDASKELKGTPAGSKGRRTREQELRTLMAVLVLGAGVLVAIYGAEGGLKVGNVDWRGVVGVGMGMLREGAGRLARGG